MLRYIRENRNSGLIYYSKIEDAPLSYILTQSSIKIENILMVFHDYNYQDFPNTGIIKGEYILFFHGGPIDYLTHVLGKVAQYIAEI